MLVPCVLQFRVTDSATGMLRDAYLGDHRQVDAKLQSQKAEMDKVNHHILTLRKNVSASPHILLWIHAWQLVLHRLLTLCGLVGWGVRWRRWCLRRPWRGTGWMRAERSP